MKIEIAKPFRPLFMFQHKLAMLNSGRIGGKSYVLAQLTVFLITTMQERDVVLCRNSQSDLEKSLYSQVESYIAKEGLTHHYDFYKAPLKIVNKINGNIIYFLGMGGSDKSRTRSFIPKHELSLVAYDELQQVKELESLLHANASFRRYLDREKGLMVEAYNPPAQNSHWINTRWNINKQDKDWLCIQSSYLDIARYISDLDLKDIIKMKIHDYERYEWFYLGKPGGGFGSVYPQFKRDMHFRPYLEVLEEFAFSRGQNLSDDMLRVRFSQRVHSVVIGGDGAVNRDATAFHPFFLMQDGRMVRGEFYRYTPEMYGQRSSFEQMPGILRWFNWLDKHYRLHSNDIPVIFAIDSAATELTRMVRLQLPEWVQVYSYPKQTIMDMVGVMQSTIASNGVVIMNFDGYHDYYADKFMRDVDDPLVVALENLVWNDKQTGYEPSVPNDDSDAMTYAINFIYRNPENIYALVEYNNSRQDYYDH